MRSDLNWRETNSWAAREIRASTDEDLWVLYSGGADSECCLLSFMDAQIPVKIAILELENGLNFHDVKYAYQFCERHKLQPEVFKMDVFKFWRSPEYYDLVDPIHCLSPIIACQLWLADQVKGVPIIAQGEVHLRKEIPEDYVPGESPYLPGPWSLIEGERLCSMYLHFMRRDKPAVPGFFQYLPEQIYTQLKDNPRIKSLVNNEIVGKLGTRSSKPEIISAFYPEIERRPKLTGFETIQEEHDILRKEMALRFPHSDQDFKFDYYQILADLSS